MTDDDSSSLPAEVEKLIQTLYAGEEQPRVRAAVLEYWSSASASRPDLERICFDVVYLGRGHSTDVLSLIEVAQQDPRDVMQQEYFSRAGKFYPYAWARRHSVNRNSPEPPPENLDLLAVAEADIRAATRNAGNGQPRMLLLTFSEASRVEAAAGKIFILSSGADSLDLSPLIEYLPWQFITPQRTLLRCSRDEDPPTLEYAENALSWTGSRGYWSECSQKLAQLGKNNVDAKIAFTFGTADLAVLVRLQRTSKTA